MSTDKKTIKTGRSRTLWRFAQLATIGELVFHGSDLASLWGIIDKNTLYTTLKRYTQQKLIYRLWQGMYALKPAEQIDPLILGIKAMHSYAYVSTETVLFNSGIISQRPSVVTLVGPTSQRFTLAGRDYLCRKLADKYLYQSIGISEKNGVRMAELSRAVADLLYYNPKIYFDAPINWKEVKRMQKMIGYPLTSSRY
jgi:predicted transcriptional regulator of viral defense system